jgi:hypothetical protein
LGGLFIGDSDVVGRADGLDGGELGVLGSVEVEAFFVGGVAVAFGEDVADRVFPAIDAFDFDEFC